MNIKAAIMAVVLLAAGSAQAEVVASSVNQLGGALVLTDNACKDSPIPGLADKRGWVVLSMDAHGTPILAGCYTLPGANLVDVQWPNGSIRVWRWDQFTPAK